MRVALMQPTFLGWLGYFALMSRVDVFVLYDNAQYVKHSFHSRSRYLVGNEFRWISLPIQQIFPQDICDARIIDISRTTNKISKLISNAVIGDSHSEAKDLRTLMSDFILSLGNQSDSLSAFNSEIIKFFSRIFSISTEVVFASQIFENMDFRNMSRERRIAEILRLTNAREYCCGPTGFSYLDAHFFRSINVIPLLFNNSYLGHCGFSTSGESIDRIFMSTFQSLLLDGLSLTKIRIKNSFFLTDAYS